MRLSLSSSDDFTSSCQRNKVYIKAKKICEKYGYQILPECYVTVGASGKETIHFGIFPPDHDSALPIIYCKECEGKQHFKIQTKYEGALSISSHTKYLEAATAANKMVKELQQLDFKNLYRVS